MITPNSTQEFISRRRPNKSRIKPKYLNFGSFFLTTTPNKIVSEQTIDEISFAEGLRINSIISRR